MAGGGGGGGAAASKNKSSAAAAEGARALSPTVSYGSHCACIMFVGV